MRDRVLGRAARQHDGDVAPAAADVDVRRHPGEGQGDVPAARFHGDVRREQAAAVDITAGRGEVQDTPGAAVAQVATAAGEIERGPRRDGERRVQPAVAQEKAAVKADAGAVHGEVRADEAVLDGAGQ